LSFETYVKQVILDAAEGDWLDLFRRTG